MKRVFISDSKFNFMYISVKNSAQNAYLLFNSDLKKNSVFAKILFYLNIKCKSEEKSFYKII